MESRTRLGPAPTYADAAIAGFVCSFGKSRSQGCGQKGVIVYKGTLLCMLHYRVRQMRYEASADGKTIPAESALAAMLRVSESAGFKCGHCSSPMTWRKEKGRVGSVATLQHNRDGAFRIVCLSCNVKHHFCEGDSFFDVPPTHRRCRTCGAVKAVADFYIHRRAKGADYIRGECKVCSVEEVMIRLRRKNPDAIARAEADAEARDVNRLTGRDPHQCVRCGAVDCVCVREVTGPECGGCDVCPAAEAGAA